MRQIPDSWRPRCICGHAYKGYHRTPGTECSHRDCQCAHYREDPYGAPYVVEQLVFWAVVVLIVLVAWLTRHR